MWLGVIHRVLPNATLIHPAPSDRRRSLHLHHDLRKKLRVRFGPERSCVLRAAVSAADGSLAESAARDRFIEIDYEALVADPQPQTRFLIAACGLDWNDACLTPHFNNRRIETASLWQARQPIYRTSVDRWRRYEPWLGELRELLSNSID